MAEADLYWGKLTCGRKLSKLPPVVALKGKKFVIGRGEDCQLQLGVKMVSSHHCYLEKDEEGKIWLYDTSSNGTFLNRTIKLIPGKGYELQDGDKVYLVYYKKRPDLDICYSLNLNCDENDLGDTAEKPEVHQKKDDTKDEIPKAKRPRLNSPPPNSCIENNSEEDRQNNVTDDTDKADKQRIVNNSKMTECGLKKDTISQKRNEIEEVLLCSLCMEILYDPISLIPCMHCYCAVCYYNWMQFGKNCPQCRAKVDSVARNHVVKNLVDAYLSQNPEKQRSKSDIERLQEFNAKIANMLSAKVTSPTRSHYDEFDDFRVRYFDVDDDESDDDSLDIFYSDRYSPEMKISWSPFLGFSAYGICRQCPRGQHDMRINRPTHSENDVNLANDVSQYTDLVQNIDESRDVEIIVKNLESFPAADRPSSSANSAVEKEASSDSSGKKDTKATNTVNKSGSQSQENPVFLYRCSPHQIHIRCSCCLEQMPDRRAERITNPNIPPQSCSLCDIVFCHLYWTCRKAECTGCLAEFSEINFGEKCLPLIIMENKVESRILVDYLARQGLTWRDLFRECIARLDSGQYTCLFNVNSRTVLCYTCGLKSFRMLAYCYRCDIPQEELQAASPRPDCYWGKNCRTQVHKLSHAMKYNHVCEQTRK